MKIRLPPFPPGLGLLLALGLLLTPQLIGQLSRFMKVKDVKFPELYETPLTGKSQTNRLRGLLMGAEGQYLSNEVFLVKELRLEHYQPDGKINLVARGPECLFDGETRVGWSTSRLEITALDGALFVEGNHGFQVRMTNSTLTISNRVRTVLRQGLVRGAKP